MPQRHLPIFPANKNQQQHEIGIIPHSSGLGSSDVCSVDVFRGRGRRFRAKARLPMPDLFKVMLHKGFALEIPARSLFNSIHEIIRAQRFEKPEAGSQGPFSLNMLAFI
jgi:hypothetical protein